LRSIIISFSAESKEGLEIYSQDLFAKFYSGGTSGKDSAGADAEKKKKEMGILSGTHYIISAGEEVIPERLKERN